MRKRNILKTIYLNEEENKLLIDECNKLGISHSEYIRNMIIKFGPKKYILQEDKLEEHKKEIEFRLLELEAFIKLFYKENNFKTFDLIISRVDILTKIFKDIYIEENL